MISKANATKGSVSAINYLLDDKGYAIEIDRFGIAGTTGSAILSEFRQIQAFNDRCTKNTYSIVLSPSNERRFTKEELVQLGREHLANLGLTGHQYLMTVHYSTDQPHIHIQCNRIGFDGKAHDDSFIGIRAQKSAQKIAERLGLTTAKEVHEKKMKETEVLPLPQQIAECNKWAMSHAYTFTEYCQLMKSKGVTIEPSLNGKGEMQGFYLIDDISEEKFKSSQISKCGLKFLPQNGVAIDIPAMAKYANLKVLEKVVIAEEKEIPEEIVQEIQEPPRVVIQDYLDEPEPEPDEPRRYKMRR